MVSGMVAGTASADGGGPKNSTPAPTDTAATPNTSAFDKRDTLILLVSGGTCRWGLDGGRDRCIEA